MSPPQKNHAHLLSNFNTFGTVHYDKIRHEAKRCQFSHHPVAGKKIVEQHQTQHCNSCPNEYKQINKVIITMPIRPLDDRAYCVRSAFTHLGLGQKLNDCSRHKFRAIKCFFSNMLCWHFRRSPNFWLQFERRFSTPFLELGETWGIVDRSIRYRAHGFLLASHWHMWSISYRFWIIC